MNDTPKIDLKNLPPESLPLPYNYIFGTRSIREDFINLSANDLHKIALQEDTGELYKLDSIGPIVWTKIINEQDTVKPTGPAGGDLEGSYPNPSIRPDSHTHTPGVTIPTYPVSLPPTGAAGGDLDGLYPNPDLKELIQNPGTYANPTIQVNEKGLITSVIPGNTNTYTSENIGSGIGIYKETESNSHKFRTISSSSSILSIEVNDDEIKLDLNDVITKQDGEFTSTVECPQLNTNHLLVKKFNRNLHVNPPSDTWTPDLLLGSLQSQIITGDIEIEFPVNYSAGDEFTLLIIQDSTGGHNITFPTTYKTRASDVINTDPGSITRVDCLLISPSAILTEVKSNYSV